MNKVAFSIIAALFATSTFAEEIPNRVQKKTLMSITSKLPGMDLKGGKGSMTESGTRVPLLAWWPGKIKPGVRDELFCLVDVLPTIASMAGIKLDRVIDGMDLSHNLTGDAGKDRQYVLMSFKKGYFVRDRRFRLHQDGTLYDIPVSSDKERYSEAKVGSGDSINDRERLAAVLKAFMAIEQDKAASGSVGTLRKNTKAR